MKKDVYVCEFKLNKGAKLVRVINPAGVPYSLIMEGDIELYNTPTSTEAQMLQELGYYVID